MLLLNVYQLLSLYCMYVLNDGWLGDGYVVDVWWMSCGCVMDVWWMSCKRDLEWLPLHCGDQRHAGLCLGWRPCTSRRRVQGRSQGTTLSASDFHNARATILNPFYNMEFKMIKKIRQNMTGIEADILGINLTLSRYNTFSAAIVYVSNDVTIPFNSVTSQ